MSKRALVIAAAFPIGRGSPAHLSDERRNRRGRALARRAGRGRASLRQGRGAAGPQDGACHAGVARQALAPPLRAASDCGSQANRPTRQGAPYPS